jgi:hypothetical protein
MQNLISMENCLIMTLKVDNKITKKLSYYDLEGR